MASGDVNTTSLVIGLCVTIPAVIAIGVCLVIYCAHRKQDRKPDHQTSTSSSYEYQHSRERPPENRYIIDFTRVNRSQQQRRSREPPPIFEPSPPSYNNSIGQTQRQSPYFIISHTPPAPRIHRASPIISPSIYSVMPPSYAEIFLSPKTLTYG